MIHTLTNCKKLNVIQIQSTWRGKIDTQSNLESKQYVFKINKCNIYLHLAAVILTNTALCCTTTMWWETETPHKAHYSDYTLYIVILN